MADYLFWIPLLPLIGFLINGLLLGKLPRPVVSAVACTSVGMSLALSIAAFFELKALEPAARQIEQTLFTWIAAGSFHVNVAFLLDPLSAVMILVVTGVGFLIHVYSTGYMHHDHDFGRYFAYLNLFTFSMLTLVLADNFLLMFVGWEGVGLCSYLLIGFWYHKQSASDAGKKAFIVNRIGDFGFLLGMFIIFWQVGSLNFTEVSARAPIVFAAGGGLITAACLLMFVGATGKSAQIPLYVWLPDAMEGPTPVSALIHAATMVTAGVYMIARTNVLYVMAPDALMVVAIVGAATAFFAATIGLAQNDIKRVLAYSTVSQLGYMFLACGVAAFTAGMFHLMTHAFFKALLFLASGSVIHAMSSEQDMRRMGGLKKYLPVTYWTMLIATLTISGIPGLSGFFSKDEILWKSFSSQYGHWALWLIGFATAGLTAFYMFRLIYMTFHGKERMDDKVRSHIHESPRSMTVPLMALAVLSVIGGFVGMPHIFGVTNYFEQWLAPVMHGAGHEAAAHALAAAGGSAAMEWGLIAASVALVLVAIFAARHFYNQRPEAATALAGRLSGLKTTLANKYYVDEIYGATVVRPLVNGSLFLWKVVDVVIIDGLINGLAVVGRDASELLRFTQGGRVRSYATIFVVGVVALVAYFIFG
ncbi:MAG: NADH-quinone oxidoreductase subunit L [candidate division Zixibacteria bacterium]|jgi:NADH-quinone oxidoreductase subunit L|nr:NADH-quinone oxidoreductase subunit L [candidate division Zixibacteria bacterium]